MEKVINDVAGMPIHYGIATNFAGFVELVDAMGGIQINLDQPFAESIQFNEPRVCDNNVYTVPTGKYENKTRKRSDGTLKVVKSYPLCYPDPKYVECGGNFNVPAGYSTLDGEKALCYVRSRYSTSDFDRAKRQQMVLKIIKDKALSLGTLTDFSKINDMLNALGDNVRTDMQIWEMQRLFDIYKNMSEAQIYQRVLENSEEGLLYNPPETKEAGYILLPRGDNYDKIRELFQNIFTMPAQSDIDPQ
jgi:anionic cell wall polymer biosynthesis LytR-Cps2A-Psr (LCP) family protein